MLISTFEKSNFHPYNVIRWRKNCISLMDSAFRSKNPNYKIFVYRFTARYFSNINKPDIACKLLTKAMELCTNRLMRQQINADLVRYTTELPEIIKE